MASREGGGKERGRVVVFTRRWRLSSQRIRTKLTLILVLPLLAIATLAGLCVTSAVSTATSDEQSRQLVILGARSAELAEELQGERAAAALVFAAGSDAGPVEDYRRRADASDTALQRFHEQRQRSVAPEAFQATLASIDSDLDDLRPLRQQVLSAPDAVASIVTLRYRVIIADLLRLRELLSQVNTVTEIASRLRAAAALGNAAEALGVVQTTMVRSLSAGQMTPATQREIVAAGAGFSEAIEEFRSLASAAWISRYEQVLTGSEVLAAERMYTIVVQAQPGPLPALGTNAKGWVAAEGTRVRLLHLLQAELDSQLISELGRRRDSARRSVGLMAGGAGLALLCVIALGVIVARSLTRSLTALRATAEAVAHTRLPEMVAQISAGSVDLDQTRRLVAETAEPIPVLTQDEVGQVAVAFNAVTTSAVRLAGEQAALRGGVQAIFNSLSRRSQRRLNTVMASIDSLQAKETDPDHLALLFQLDHAATGLRRLTAGLQVLAGGRAGAAQAQPVALVAVLRAAQSEIDQYQRVDIGTVDDDLQLHGETVEEVIHLLAELLDNAARFSPPTTLVVVDGRRVGDLLHIQITDEGKGMTEDQLAAARDRIANPHRLDHHAASQMGLPVVAAIAGRLKITVQLRSVQPHGTRVDLTLPPGLFEVVPTTGSPDSKHQQLLGAEAASAEAVPASTPDEISAAAELPALESWWRSASSWPSPVTTAQLATAQLATAQPTEPVGEPAGEALTGASIPPDHTEPAPEIYQQLKHAWFAGSTTALGRNASAASADEADPTGVTASGLPLRRRVPGQTAATEHPAPDQHATAHSPAEPRRNRDSDQLRRRYAGLDRGLMAARRRSASSDSQEDPQP